MQIRNKIHIGKYLIGTILNVLQSLYFFAAKDYPVLVLFYVTVLVNQYFLVIFAADFLGVEENKTMLPTSIYGILKLVVIIFGFYYAMSNTENMEVFLVLTYIFQLIILVLSTKRVVKKN